MSERRSNLRPALAVSGGLHLAILLAMLVSWRMAPPLAKPLGAVAVSIISSAPMPDVRAAVKAPERQTAAAPKPAPPSPEPPSPVEAPAPPAPTPPPPAPAPEPRPHPRPRPRPIPAPKPEPAPAPPPPRPVPHPKPTPKPKPAPVAKPVARPPPPKPLPKPPPDLLESLSAEAPKRQARAKPDLLASLATPTGRRSPQPDLLNSLLAEAPAGGRRGAAPRGAARAETDVTARQAAKGQAAASVAALQAKITRLWNPECGVKVDIHIYLRGDHSLATKPIVNAEGSKDVDDATVASASQHALAAVEQAAPFTDLPANAPRDLNLHFKATDGCG